MDSTQLPPGMFTPERPRNANGDSTMDQVRAWFSPATLFPPEVFIPAPRARAPRPRRDLDRDTPVPSSTIPLDARGIRVSLSLTHAIPHDSQVASLSPFFDFASTLSPIAPSRVLGGQGMSHAGSVGNLAGLAGGRSPTPLCFNSPNAQKRYVHSHPRPNLDRPSRVAFRTSPLPRFPRSHDLPPSRLNRTQLCACRQVRWRP